MLCVLPGGKGKRGSWNEQVVSELLDEHTVVVGKGKHRKTIAREDVRKLPESDFAQSIVLTQHWLTKDGKKKNRPRTK